jgi:hypothetical protein
MDRGIEADTLALSRRGVEPSLKKSAGMVYRLKPPGDPKPLRRWTSQRRESRAWIRDREVESSQPPIFPVSDAVTSCDPLFFHPFRKQLRFSGNM